MQKITEKKIPNAKSTYIAGAHMLPEYNFDYRKTCQNSFAVRIAKDIRDAQWEFQQGLCRPATPAELLVEILSEKVNSFGE